MEGNLAKILTALLVVAIVGTALAVLALAPVYRRLQELDVPGDAGFVETLHRVPLALVVALDLLDLALDVLAAPLVWKLLGHLHLEGLRKVTTLEAVIPGTQAIPTLTAAWLAVRLLRWGRGERGTTARPDRRDR